MADTILDQTTPQVPESVQPAPVVEATVTPEVSVAPAKWHSDEFDALVINKGFKDPNDALKSLSNLEKLVGNSVRVPAADASPEAKADFLAKIKDVEGVLLKSDEKLLNKLGKPETPEAYKFTALPEDLSKLAADLSADVESFKKVAFEAGLTDSQAATLLTMRLNEVKSADDAFLAAKAKGEETLRTLWGADFDNRLDAVKQVNKIYLDKFGEDMQALVNSPAGNNPALLNMMNELAEIYKEHNHAGMSTTQFGMTPEQALSKISEKRADRGFMEAYTSDTHPGHKKAVADLQQLYIVSQGG